MFLYFFPPPIFFALRVPRTFAFGSPYSSFFHPLHRDMNMHYVLIIVVFVRVLLPLPPPDVSFCRCWFYFSFANFVLCFYLFVRVSSIMVCVVENDIY